jgi:hypothetical protein
VVDSSSNISLFGAKVIDSKPVVKRDISMMVVCVASGMICCTLKIRAGKITVEE